MEQKKLSRNRKPVRTGKLAATDLTADFGAMLVESSPDALIALADHTVLFWNSGGGGDLRYTKEEAAGRTLCDLVVPSELVDESRKSTHTQTF
jgi:hypothetical protein